jgi:predicted DNA-binding ribbon-helix-helix protein
MPRSLHKRSVLIAGHATSLSLEAEFWRDLRDVARQRRISLNALIASVDATRQGNLSSALRLFVLECYRKGELQGAGAER